MKIKWPNLIALAVVITLTVLIVKAGPASLGLLRSVSRIGSNISDLDDRYAAFMALAMVLIACVVVVRTLAPHRKES